MDESLISSELQERIGVDGPSLRQSIGATTARRLLETVEGLGVTASSAGATVRDNRPTYTNGDLLPAYAVLALETGVPVPSTPSAPEGLVTGDEWSLMRQLRVGEPLTVVGRVASVHERFGSRFGHNLVIRTSSTVMDEAGAVVAEIGHSMIRFRAPDERATGHAEPPIEPQSTNGAGGGRSLADVERFGFWQAVETVALSDLREGSALPARTVYPLLHMVLRYCGLTWNYVPFFFDADDARRSGLPGTIVPGPLKHALLTYYLASLVGDDGAVRAVRVAHRRPDPTGRPLVVSGAVTRVSAADHGVEVDCEIWTMNERGERSVMGSATLAAGSANA
jgi:hypothetical protein